MILDLPDIRQAADYDCGAAAVDTVSRHWGLRARGPRALSNAVQGMSPDTVEAVLRSLGLSVLSGTMTLADLRHLADTGRPVLCCVADGGGHWVVVRGVFRSRVYYHCPERGPVSETFAAWNTKWADETVRGRPFVRWGICAFRA